MGGAASVAGRHRLGHPDSRRRAARAPDAGRPASRRVHPGRPRVGAGEGAARDGDRRAGGGTRHRPPLRHGEGRRAGVRGRRGDGDRGRARRRVRPERASRTSCRRARSPPTGIRRTTSSCSTCPPTTRRGRCPSIRAAIRDGAGPRDRAVRRAGVLRRRPGGVRGGPPAERAHLAAARRACAPARVRLGRGVGGARWRWAALRWSLRWPAIFLLASVTPMSIFVLNLATLLGLGLGVDYSLLMTSRFREEMAARAWKHDAVEDAVGATVRTAGRAVFFSGLTVLLGLLGLVLFEFMILRSVGIAGAIVVALSVVGGDDPAAGDPRDHRRPTSSACGSVASPRSRAARGRLVAARLVGDAPPDRRCSCRPSPFCSSSERRSCTSGSTLPTPGSSRSRAVAAAVRPAHRGVRAGAVRADRARDPDAWSGDGHREPRGAVSSTRAGSRPTLGSSASTASSTSTRG